MVDSKIKCNAVRRGNADRCLVIAKQQNKLLICLDVNVG